MNKNEKNNGLKLIKLKTQKKETGAITSWSDIKTNLGKSAKYVIFYFDYGIEFAIQNGNSIFFSDGDVNLENLQLDYLQLARFFDENMELKIWRDGENNHHFRLYQDSTNEDGETEGVEAKQILWGTRAASFEKPVTRKVILNGKVITSIYWTTLSEKRGTQLIVPLFQKLTIEENASHPRVAVKTYNYIDYLENGLASYVDSRFVDIKIWKEGE